MPKLFKKRRARKQAEEAARKQAIKENREANRAKREAYFKRGEESSANLKASKAASAQKAKDDAISSRVVVGGKTYTNQAAADMAQSREASKRDDLNRVRRSKNIASKKEAKGGFYEKTGSDGKTRTVISRGKEESDEAFKARSTKARAEYKPKAKHGGALAIMIAPVKTKNKKTVKAIKKGAKAQYGAAMKKMPTYKNGGRVLTESQKRAAAGPMTKSDPKKQAAQPPVSKPPGMGKVSSLKNGGKVEESGRASYKKGRGKRRVKNFFKSKKTKAKEAAEQKAKRDALVAKNLSEKVTYSDQERKDDKAYMQVDRAMRANQLKKIRDKAGKGGYRKMNNGGKVTKSQKLQQRDKDLKKKATTALKEGKTKKYSRVQKRRIKVQKREQTAFMKENT